MQLSFLEYDLHVGYASKTLSMNIFHGPVVFRTEPLEMQVPRESSVLYLYNFFRELL